MRLLLSMLRWPDGAKPEIREIESEMAIGRGRDAEWMFPDPTNQLSRRHCLLTPFGESWRIMDLSLNGTFINESNLPIGRQQSHELHDGDCIRIGPYVIEARYQAPASLGQPIVESVPFGFTPTADNVRVADPVQQGPWGAAVPGGFTAGIDPRSHAMADDFLGPPSADHSPAVSDVWIAPPPSRVVLPDDWDLEEVPLAPAVSAPAHPEILPTPGAPSGDGSHADDDLASIDRTRAIRLAGSPGDGMLLAAFLHGTGLTDLGDVNPVAMMEAVGRTLRVMVDRLREVQATRGTIKREFRILATAVRPDDNNPIKFSASNEAALRSLLTGKHPPDRAVGEVLGHIRLHELAMIAAMRDAVRGLLAELDPAPLRAAAQEPGLAGMLPIQRRARAFDQYEALHARTVQALADDFDSVFGKAFARAYERVALDDENRPAQGQR